MCIARLCGWLGHSEKVLTAVSPVSLRACSLLVNIYGSREMFVNEFRNLLADRLLQSLNYDTSREVSTVYCVVESFDGVSP